MTAFIGIDPGVTGAFGVIAENYYVDIIDLPVLDGYVDAPLLMSLLGRIENAVIAIEQQIAMPKQSVRTTAKVFQNYGTVLAVARLTDKPMYIVRPRDWKKDLRLSASKDDSLTTARNLFPSARDKLTRKKDHDRAEALLIAHWCREKHGGKPTIPDW